MRNGAKPLSYFEWKVLVAVHQMNEPTTSEAASRVWSNYHWTHKAMRALLRRGYIVPVCGRRPYHWRATPEGIETIEREALSCR